LDAGLSLADVARDDVSRTFIHFVEHGKSRPSQAVLTLIARRTGKPVSYFINKKASDEARSGEDLAAELSRVASRVRLFIATHQLTVPEREAMKLLELTLRRGAVLTNSLSPPRSPGRSAAKPPGGDEG
jgi:transcriptional regulator with XRE-family HTH domain